MMRLKIIFWSPEGGFCGYETEEWVCGTPNIIKFPNKVDYSMRNVQLSIVYSVCLSIRTYGKIKTNCGKINNVPEPYFHQEFKNDIHFFVHCFVGLKT